MLSVPDNKVVSDTVVERSLLTAIVLLKGVQMVNDLVDHFLEVDHLMDRCLKFKQEIGDSMAPQRETHTHIYIYI